MKFSDPDPDQDSNPDKKVSGTKPNLVGIFYIKRNFLVSNLKVMSRFWFWSWLKLNNVCLFLGVIVSLQQKVFF